MHRANDIASIGADVFCCRIRSAGVGGRGDRSSLCTMTSPASAPAVALHLSPPSASPVPHLFSGHWIKASLLLCSSNTLH